jgi:hypothetical protein
LTGIRAAVGVVGITVITFLLAADHAITATADRAYPGRRPTLNEK